MPLIVGTNSDEASFAKAIYQTTKTRQRAARRALEAFDPDNAQSVLRAYDYAGERATMPTSSPTRCSGRRR